MAAFWQKRKLFYTGIVCIALSSLATAAGASAAFNSLMVTTTRECRQYYDDPPLELVLLVGTLLGLGLLIVTGLWIGSKRAAPSKQFVPNHLHGAFNILANVIGWLSLGALAALSSFTVITTVFKWHVQTSYPACSYGKQSIFMAIISAGWPLVFLLAVAFFLGAQNSSKQQSTRN